MSRFESNQKVGQFGSTGKASKNPLIVKEKMEDGDILLMAVILHQLLDSLSHYLQGFSTVPGGCLGLQDFFHQQYDDKKKSTQMINVVNLMACRRATPNPDHGSVREKTNTAWLVGLYRGLYYPVI